jgi:hypothetical protein
LDLSPRPKAACFFNPINAVQFFGGGWQKRIPTCNKSIQRRECGWGDNKQYWGIEMNHAQTLYLGSYYQIDRIDGLIQNSQLFCEVGNIGTLQFYMAKGLCSCSGIWWVPWVLWR